MKSGRAVFLGFTVPDELARQLIEADPVPAVQTHKFAWSFAIALSEIYEEVFLLSVAPVQTFPITPFKSFEELEFEQHGIRGTMLAASNMRVVRHFSRFISCLRFTPRLRSNWGPNVVFVHGVHTPFLAYSALLRLLGLKSVIVLTDPAGVVLATDNRLRRGLKSIDKIFVKILLRSASGIIALAPKLTEAMAPRKQSIIIPGIISTAWQNDVARLSVPRSNSRFTVTYAGGVEENYGVGLLIKAAALLPDIDFHICGKGGYLETARAIATQNVKILGFLEHEAVAKELMCADLLINPRPTDVDFAAQSFPSKLLEYFATGRPVMSTKIPSIPRELRDMFYSIEEETAAGIAASIRVVSSLSNCEREGFGFAAQQRAVGHFGATAIAGRLATFGRQLR